MSTARDVVSIYWKELKRHKALVFLVGGTVTISTLLEIGVPILYERFINGIAGGGTEGELLKIVYGIGLLNLSWWLLYRISTFANAYIQPLMIANLKKQAFDTLMRHSFGFFADNYTGALVQRVNRYARAFESIMDRIVMDVVPLVLRFLGIGVVLYFTNPIIAAGVVSWILIFLVLNTVFAIWKMRYGIALAQRDSTATAVLADAITNHTAVQLFTGTEAERSRFTKAVDDVRKYQSYNWYLDGVVEAIQAFLFVVIEFFVFYYGYHLWKDGAISVGTFALLQGYMAQITGRLWFFGWSIRQMYEAFADAKEMVDDMKKPPEIVDVPDARTLTVGEGRIVFDAVTFGYQEDRAILDNFSLTVSPGERIALIGPSGAGKSTIVKLLFRLYDLEKGSIAIDGTSIMDVTQESLRKNIGFVPQEPVLFHRSLMENIRYGRPDATDEDVYAAARLAYCDEFIRALPDGYNSLVGERGVKLSGGERQRIAIARVIVKNAPLLVLDEATSSLDSESEQLIQQALDNLMKGKTTIAIAHRLSTIRRMDRIIVIESGRIAEQGTHDELLAHNGLYARLWSLQSGGFIHDEAVSEVQTSLRC